MKSPDLSNKTTAELQDSLKLQFEEQFKFRMQKSVGQLGQTHLLKRCRKKVAQIKTLIKQKAGV